MEARVRLEILGSWFLARIRRGEGHDLLCLCSGFLCCTGGFP